MYFKHRFRNLPFKTDYKTTVSKILLTHSSLGIPTGASPVTSSKTISSSETPAKDHAKKRDLASRSRDFFRYPIINAQQDRLVIKSNSSSLEDFERNPTIAPPVYVLFSSRTSSMYRTLHPHIADLCYTPIMSLLEDGQTVRTYIVNCRLLP